MATVEDLIVERQISEVMEIAQLRSWPFERLEPRSFRVSLCARDGDIYQLEVDCEDFPSQPPSFHWRNRETGDLDCLSDSPNRYDYFHGSGRICAPWNRLASMPGGPHRDWERINWQENPRTKGTNTLAAMMLRIHHELRSSRYRGRRK